MDGYTIYLIPPLSGAAIGYLTNYLAIRMLFRPLNAWRILGIRVPMTPGVIPAKRSDFAKNMGRMVGQHLLPREDIAGIIENETFRSSMRVTVEDTLDNILNREFKNVESMLPEHFRDLLKNLLGRLEDVAVDAIVRYVRSDSFQDELDQAMGKRIDSALKQTVGDLLGPEGIQRLVEVADERVRSAQKSKQFSQAVSQVVDEKIESFLVAGGTIEELLPAGFKEALFREIEGELPRFLEKHSSLIYDPSFRKKLRDRAKSGVKGLLGNLGFLARILSIKLTDDMLNSKIDELLEGSAADISQALKSPETQKKITEFLEKTIDAFLNRPLTELLSRLPYSKVAVARNIIKQNILEAVGGDKLHSLITDSIRNSMDSLAKAKCESVLRLTLSKESVEMGTEAFKRKALAFVYTDEFERLTRHAVEGLLDNITKKKRVGKLSALLPADIVLGLERYAYNQVMSLLTKEVPRLVESLDISAIVEKKVNELELLEVESLIEDIMREQFKYINLFGALLGALIGLINTLIFL